MNSYVLERTKTVPSRKLWITLRINITKEKGYKNPSRIQKLIQRTQKTIGENVCKQSTNGQ